MKAIEFDTELHGEPSLPIPAEMFSQMPRCGSAKVIVLLGPLNTFWGEEAYQQFMRQDTADEAVYGCY